MLVTTSLNDSQVMYHEPAKYVAKLRTLKTGQEPAAASSATWPPATAARPAGTTR